VSPRSSTDDAAVLVQRELAKGLPEFSGGRFDVGHRAASDGIEVVEWEYEATPRADSEFLGVQLVHPLTLRGVTLVRKHGRRAEFKWYIDWLDSLGRSGLNAAIRPVPDGPQLDLSTLVELRDRDAETPS
jgi:hypothetical protein